MECPEENLRSGPPSRDAAVNVYISVVNSFNPSQNSRPTCRLKVTTPKHSTLYQTMKLAERQHPRRFNFTDFSDLFEGHVLRTINGVFAHAQVSSWLLADGATGESISKGLDKIMVNAEDSFIWRYVDYSVVLKDKPYTGDCLRSRNYVTATSRVNYAIFYLSVQFWSSTWPLCKVPVVIIDRTLFNLNDVMLEAKRQHSSCFTFQVYTNNELHAINELALIPGSDLFSWKANIAGSQDSLSTVLYRTPLQDGDHVIWRYLDADGNPRLRPPTTPPPTQPMLPEKGFAWSNGNALSAWKSYRRVEFLLGVLCICSSMYHVL